MPLLKLKASTCRKWFFIFLLTFAIVYLSLIQLSKASLYGIINIFTVDFPETSIENVHKDLSNYLLLENILKKENELINTKLKLFFIQTSENENILSRHACSIESAARLHPNGLIFVLMRSKYIDIKKDSYLHLISYKNIHFVHFDEEDIYSGTSLARLNQTKRTQYIHYFSISHMSDFIRTALLYKYGGIYFDLDVIPLRSFDSFKNSVALETDDGVNVAVLVFEKQHVILDLQMDIQLKSIESKFNSLCWNCLGPLALTNALKQLCDRQQLSIHNKDKCHEIDIQPSFVFYPIPYEQIPQFFRYSSESVNFLLKNLSIFSIHYFHHMTMNIPIETLSPFAQIAEIYCPNIYQDLINEKLTNDSTNFLFTNTNLIFFCLFISIICIFIFILLAYFISYLRQIRMILFPTRQKFSKSSYQ